MNKTQEIDSKDVSIIMEAFDMFRGTMAETDPIYVAVRDKVKRLPTLIQERERLARINELETIRPWMFLEEYKELIDMRLKIVMEASGDAEGI